MKNFENLEIMKKIIGFDVDKTVTPHNSWAKLTEAFGYDYSFQEKLYDQSQKGIIQPDKVSKILLLAYSATGLATKKFITDLLCSIEPYPEAIELFRRLKERDYFVYLISGGISIHVESIAGKLSANGWFADSWLEFDKDNLLSKINYSQDQSEMKVRQIGDIAQIHQISVKEVFFVGDGENDIGAFKKTGKGIAVHTKNQLVIDAAWKNTHNLLDMLQFLP